MQPARKWLTESPSQIHHFYTQKPFLTAILGTQPIMATVMMMMMMTPMVMIMMIVLSQVVPGTQCSQSNAHDAEAHISRNCTWSVTIIFCKCVPFILMRCTRLGTSSTKKNGKMWEFFPSRRPPPFRVGKCQIFYTDQYQQTPCLGMTCL